jgi:hypothetical protein
MLKYTYKIACFLMLVIVATTIDAQVIDTISFGNTASETGHALIASNTKVLAGNLGQSATQCLVPATPNIYGGSLTFTINVDSVHRNYFTVKLWGGDDQVLTTAGRLYLYAIENGVNYQVGYRHAGDYMPLSVMGTKPPLPGRFFYSTTLLPLSFTHGKTSVTLKIVSTGQLYGLGAGGPPNGDYQYYMTQPSRGIYKAYTHINPYLDVSNEVQGTIPTTTIMPTPTISVMQKGGTYYNDVNNYINNRLNTATSVTAFTTSDILFLAKSYFVPNLSGYNNTAVITKVTALIDAFAADYYSDNAGVYGGADEGWGGRYGNIGYAIYLLRNQMGNTLDLTANYGTNGGVKTHRQAWGDILTASRDFGRTTRDARFITNQCLLADESIYRANKGLLALSDARAFPEQLAQRYLKESIGLSPWLGSDDTTNNSSSLIAGSNYYQVTQKKLSREYGYVGYSYGEMQRHCAYFYRYTGNPIFKDQAIKMLKARIYFRRPAVQVSGTSYYKSMEDEGLLAWRGVRECDGDFADGLAYGDEIGNTGPLTVAASTLDPDCIAYAKQCFSDNQFFAGLNNTLAITPEGLDVFSDYTAINNATDNGKRLPMTDGQPDFAWADEEDGIAVIKKDSAKLWIEPYWQVQSQNAVYGAGRFHYSTPSYDQYGDLETNPAFTYSGQYITRPNYVDGMGNTEYAPPDNPGQLYAGEKLPVSANGLVTPPAGIITSSTSTYSPFMGKADGYAFRFGKFLVGMNSSFFKPFTLNVPIGFTGATDLISGQTDTANVTLSPLSTAVLYLNNNIDSLPVPTAPLLIYIRGRVTTTANLVWRAASGAVNYNLKRSTVKGGPYTTISTVADTTFADIGLTTGTTYYYAVSATNTNGESYNSMEVSTAGFKASAPQISNAITDTAYVGTPYFYTIAGFYSPTSFSATSLPAGLSINTYNGIISGSPLAAGVYTIPVTVKNSVGNSTANFTLVVVNPNPPVITSPDTTTAYLGVPFSYQIAATNSPTSFNADTLPAALSIDTVKGIISGTLLSKTTIHLHTYATNIAGTGSGTLAILVTTPPAPVITSSITATGVVGQPFTYAINATNAPYSYKATNLPAGLTIDTTTGLISGVAVTSCTVTVTISATNDGGTTKGTVTFYLLNPPSPPWVDSNIGSALNGYAAFNPTTGTYTVTGNGNDIGGTVDGFNFLYRPINCATAVSFIAQLSSRQLGADGGGTPADKVGIMMRESTADNAKEFNIYINADRVVQGEVRSSTGGGTAAFGTPISLDIPVWLRIDRNDSIFTAYASLDSSTWETLGSSTFGMDTSMLVGMCVTSRQANLDVSVYDSVSITTGCSTLPVTISNYQAAWKGNNIVVGWVSLSEQNNSHFILMRSPDGINYTEAATIPSLGNGSHVYQWIDDNPYQLSNYYKLLQVDMDGATTDLGIRLVRTNHPVGTWTIYPNPMRNGNCIIKNNTAINKQVDIKLYDAVGKLLSHQSKLMSSNTLPLSFDNVLAAGVYWLQIDNGTVLKLVVGK